MTDPIESPEAFARALCENTEWPDDEEDQADVIAWCEALIRSRDAAIRAEALEDAIAAGVAGRRALALLRNDTHGADIVLDNIRDLLKRGRLR